MFELDLLGDAGLERDLVALAAGLDDPETFLREDAAPLEGAAVRRAFDTGGRPEPWPDITAKSRAERKVDAASGPLIDSGALEDAASDGRGGVAGSLFSVSGDTLTMGTDLVYAATQNFGRADANVPARLYEDLTPGDALALGAAYEDDYLHRLLAGMTP